VRQIRRARAKISIPMKYPGYVDSNFPFFRYDNGLNKQIFQVKAVINKFKRRIMKQPLDLAPALQQGNLRGMELHIFPGQFLDQELCGFQHHHASGATVGPEQQCLTARVENPLKFIDDPMDFFVRKMLQHSKVVYPVEGMLRVGERQDIAVRPYKFV
jgi:hypothetical protein